MLFRDWINCAFFYFLLQNARDEGQKKKEKKEQQQDEEHDPDDSYSSNMGSNLCTSDDKEPGSENNPYRTEEEVSFSKSRTSATWDRIFAPATT